MPLSEVIVWNFSGCSRIRARVALACILSLRDGEKLSVHPPIEGREPGEVLLRHPASQLGTREPTRTPAFASPSALREWVYQSRNAG